MRETLDGSSEEHESIATRIAIGCPPEMSEADEKPESADVATEKEPTPEIVAPPSAPPIETKKAEADDGGNRWKMWTAADSRSRRILFAIAIYLLCVVVFAIFAGQERMGSHTAFNHYAQLADAWLHGKQDIVRGGPHYAGGNDFADFQGKTYISFPPFPAVLMLPLVWLSGAPEDFRDGQFIVWLAGVGPAGLFLVLEKLRRTKRVLRSERDNVLLAIAFAFCTVYFFTAVQGTVWFAAHVVGVAALVLYMLFALDADRPFWAGVCMACAWTTRVLLILTAVMFVVEAVRVSCKDYESIEGNLFQRIETALRRVDRAAFFRRFALFALPLLVSVALCSYYNKVRFGDPRPWAFGHEYLPWVRGSRLAAWGLFSYHYAARNLGVVLTSLPFLAPKGGDLRGAPFEVSAHGLALWFTTPMYLYLLWPKKRGGLHLLLWLTALGPIVGDLLYQNTGWAQFGYRFSNDYAPILFVLIALGARPLGKFFYVLCAWALVWNAFGAVTFDHTAYGKYYFSSRDLLYQPD